MSASPTPADEASLITEKRSNAIAAEAISLSKIYPNGRGIRGITFQVLKGEVFGLLGPNGAGKTTTIRILLDFIRPTGGTALLLGVDSRAMPSARSSVGFLPGDLTLHERSTGRDWLSFQAEMRSGVDEQRLQSLCESLEADLDEPLRNLSSGNRQKIGIINALMHKPDLVIMDEPASGLDPMIRRRLYSMLSDVRDRGGAVLLSSHVLPEVERICDRVAIIRNGELIAVDTLEHMRSQAIRHFSVTFAGDPPLSALEEIPGVVSIDAGTSNGVRIGFSGRLRELLKTLAMYEVTDLSSGEQALEDRFMSYYGTPPRPQEE